ncbi:MAG TPA: VTC domain-containing protein [Candidatus Limnocylindria bacterium]|nr:VTC domain-containing protein [Candidatus Limnocylindria bacterium]
MTEQIVLPRSRHEERFIASEQLVRLVMRTASAHLQLARDDLPYQWLTTCYCDTVDWNVYRAAEEGAAVRLRFREYHRTRPEQIFGSEQLFLEVKEDIGDRWRKERVAIRSAEIPAYLRGESPMRIESRDLQRAAQGLVTAGARPVVVTQYNRLAYAAPDDRMRVTADHNLSYLAVPWTNNNDDAIPGRIGPVLARERDVIVEMKWFDELPLWAEELHGFLKQRAPLDRPSKFIMAMRHLLGKG